MNYEPGDYYTCREFMSDFVAPPAAREGLRNQIDSKVYSESINTRTLVATIVRRPRDADAPRTIEIAPARVEVDPDETDWCLLRIDHNYARRHLDNQEFDVYVSLRCNVVTPARTASRWTAICWRSVWKTAPTASSSRPATTRPAGSSRAGLRSARIRRGTGTP